jgi:tRNA-Thr(GGU) m(6)t(6)A37 methyltransferase TsaA
MTGFQSITAQLSILTIFFTAGLANAERPEQEQTSPIYQVWPIGWVRKHENRTFIEIEKPYLDAMMGLEESDAIWVLYWFDRNDRPEQRKILQVHPFGDSSNPLRGVFATRAPVRPNLIALSRCRIIKIDGRRIEIDDIDAFPDTPVLDIKP